MYQESFNSFLEETLTDKEEVTLIKSKVNPQNIII